MIVYYTGTGNSRYVAEALVYYSGDELFDATAAMCRGETAKLHSDKPWVFVSPTYAWRIPRVFAEWISKGEFSGSKDAYFAMTCGSEIGNAEKYTRDYCEKWHFNFHGLLEVKMPENYVAMFYVPDEAESAAIRAEANKVLETAGKQLAQGLDFDRKPVKLHEKLMSGPVNPGFYKFCVKSKAFTVSDKCISCGKCEASCPVHGVKLVGGKPVWTGDCTHCMACICGCPAGAIEYGKISVGKPRYQCPHFEPKI